MQFNGNTQTVTVTCIFMKGNDYVKSGNNLEIAFKSHCRFHW